MYHDSLLPPGFYPVTTPYPHLKDQPVWLLRNPDALLRVVFNLYLQDQVISIPTLCTSLSLHKCNYQLPYTEDPDIDWDEYIGVCLATPPINLPHPINHAPYCRYLQMRIEILQSLLDPMRVDILELIHALIR
jgi:hypothetical protein